MNEKEKTTVPIPPVGADGEQSLSYVSNEIISAEMTKAMLELVKHRLEFINSISETDDVACLALYHS